jgi:peptidoglycan/LPS O-acetylase OafA/YrhL
VGSQSRSAALDGLRGLAALSVLCFHVWLYRPGAPPGPRDALADKLLFETNRGLILFFVLSGFLLYRGFVRRRVDLRVYALRRVARIVPAYYACILGCLVLYAAAGPRAAVPPVERLPLFAVFGQNYSRTTVMQLDPVTWTLGVEAAFYVVLPLIAVFALRLSRTWWHFAALAGLVAVTLGWNATTDGNFLATKALPAWIGCFALGMAVALWVERGGRLGRGACAGALVGGGALVVLNGYWHETAAPDAFVRAELGNLPAAAGFALVLAAVVAGGGRLSRGLGARPLAAVGAASYGIYLWHVPLLLAGRSLGLLPAAFVPRLLVAAPLALAAGWLSWRAIERPSIEWAARIGSRPRWTLRPASSPIPTRAPSSST